MTSSQPQTGKSTRHHFHAHRTQYRGPYNKSWIKSSVKTGADFRFLDLEEVHATVSPPFRSGGTHSGSGHDWGKSPEINRKAVDVRLHLATCF